MDGNHSQLCESIPMLVAWGLVLSCTVRVQE
jgi:hypothetical protein